MTARTEKQWLYWLADPHRWGDGRTHLVEEEDRQKTLCGRLLETCPGRYIETELYSVNCGGCRKSFESRLAREKREAEFQKSEAARRLERETQSRAWWKRYQDYLESQEWARKRAAVLSRENWLCEACRERPATQVHHSTYKHLFHEPLFELHALCYECHEKITDLDRNS